MKKILWVLILIVILLGVLIIVDRSKPKVVDEGPIKIGVIAPMTGKGAIWGETVSNGIQLALEEINADGGVLGHDLEVIIEDDELDVKKSISGFNKLVDIDGIVALIGPAGSSNAKAVVPLIKDKQIPTILTAVGVSDITLDNPTLFRIWPSERMKALAIQVGLEKYGYKKIAIITTNNESALDTSKQLRENVLAPLGIEVVIEEIVEKDTTDFRTSFTKIKGTEHDALFINLYAGQVGLGIKQAKELGLTSPMFSSVLADSVDEWENAQGAMEGVWFPGAPLPSNDFQQKYKERFGVDSSLAAPTSYDALKILARVINEVGTDSEDIQQALYDLNDYEGAFGKIIFDEQRNAPIELPIKVVKDGVGVVMEI